MSLSVAPPWQALPFYNWRKQDKEDTWPLPLGDNPPPVASDTWAMAGEPCPQGLISSGEAGDHNEEAAATEGPSRHKQPFCCWRSLQLAPGEPL